MAVIKAVSSHSSIKNVLDYVTKDEKTEEKLLSGFNCSPDTAAEEMQATKDLWGKTGGRTYKHFVQSYHQDEQITPEQAHDLACQFAKECPQLLGFEVLIATHKDRAHIHTHFIVNSVSFEDGHKFRMHKDELQQMKDLSDRICIENHLDVCTPGRSFSGEVREETTAYKKDAFYMLKAAERGEVKSWVQDLALSVLECRDAAKSREEFVQRLKEKGISVSWEDTRKHITFTDQARQAAGLQQCKIRNSKLEQYYNLDFSKGGMQREFKKNLCREQTRADRGRELAAACPGAEPDAPEKSAAAFLGDYRTARAASEKRLAVGLKKCRNSALESKNRAAPGLAAVMAQQLAQVVRQETDQARGEHREKI